jgi:TonB family protein
MLGFLRPSMLGAVLSVALHLTIVLLLPAGSTHPTSTTTLAQNEINLELQWHASGTSESPIGHRSEDAPELMPGGITSDQNIDARERGRGGERTGASSFIMLVPRASTITLSDAPMNAQGIGQTQRIDTARDRATSEDRRATPHPADDAFLASGSGVHRERRPVATVDARAGARAPLAAALARTPREETAVSMSDPGSLSRQDDSREMEGRPREGSNRESPGRGILRGQGDRPSERAHVAFGRPSVDEGRAATTSESRDGPVRDDANAELLATQMRQSVVEASPRRGEDIGSGLGGTDARGAPGTGRDSREGGRAHALGPGTGSWDALDTSDGRYRRWFVQMRRRIENALVFPRERAIAMDQGTSVYVVVVRRDGTLAGTPQLIRSSGFRDLDGAALSAIRRNVPFSPLPDDLVPGRSSIEVRLPIEFSNPMIR